MECLEFQDSSLLQVHTELQDPLDLLDLSVLPEDMVQQVIVLTDHLCKFSFNAGLQTALVATHKPLLLITVQTCKIRIRDIRPPEQPPATKSAPPP